MRYITTISFFILILLFTDNEVFSQDYSKIDKVVIDAGHGGKDPGTLGAHSREKDVALAIALKLGKLITDNLPDVNVIYTRKTDVFIELYKRAHIANEAKADLFISIHCNSIDTHKAHGTETWVMGTYRNKKNLEVAKKENSAILLEADYNKNYDNFDPNSPESYISFSLLQSAYHEQSMFLAENVQSQFRNRVKRLDRGVKEAGFLVLVYTAMPSILIETGFLSNYEEEKFLTSEQGQDYIASAIYRAFKTYKYSIEGNNVDEESDSFATDSIAKEEPKPKPETSASKSEKDEPKTEAYFGVQFSTLNKKVDVNKSFKGVNNVWYYKGNGVYKYVSGKYSSFSEANKSMKNIRKGLYKDAFVVAFVNGKRVSRAEAEKYLKK
jgi:N-acetylmuramoyl-L-alanine amidase